MLRPRGTPPIAANSVDCCARAPLLHSVGCAASKSPAASTGPVIVALAISVLALSRWPPVVPRNGLQSSEPGPHCVQPPPAVSMSQIARTLAALLPCGQSVYVPLAAFGFAASTSRHEAGWPLRADASTAAVRLHTMRPC